LSNIRLPEFRYNRRRKHYSYIFKQSKGVYYNILLSSKANEIKKREGRIVTYNNVPLYKHPNPNKPNESQWVINRVYKDSDFNKTFDKKLNWRFHLFDKRKIKKIKKKKY